MKITKVIRFVFSQLYVKSYLSKSIAYFCDVLLHSFEGFFACQFLLLFDSIIGNGDNLLVHLPSDIQRL